MSQTPNPYETPVASTSTSTPADDAHGSAGQRATITRYIVLAGLCVAAMIAYVGRNCLGLAENPISRELNISLKPMGWVMGTFFWTYALAQIPAGWLGHVWGPRKALALYALLWSVACFAMGAAAGFWSLIAAQLAFGIGQAGLFPCAAAVISRWIPEKRRAIASGLLGGSQSLGGAIGTALTGALLAGTIGFWWGDTFIEFLGVAVNWRTLYAIYAVPGILWAMWFFLWFRDRPQDHRAVNKAELALYGAKVADTTAAAEPAPATPWGKVLTNFDVWMIFGQQFCRAAGYIFFPTWFPRFLQETRGLSIEASGWMAAQPLLAIVVGCPLGGWIADQIYHRTGSKRLSRQGVAITAMLGSAGCIFAAYFAQDARQAVNLMTAGAFLAGLGGSCGYAVTIDKAGQFVAPIFGAMNMAGNLAAAICPVVVAWIAEEIGWNIVLMLFVAIYIGAAVCWGLLNPEGTIDD